MLILICNVGSTSLKYKLIGMPSADIFVDAKIERVGSKNNSFFSYKNIRSGQEFKKDKIDIPGFSYGISIFLKYLTDDKFGAISSIDELAAVGFKTVHGKGVTGVRELSDEVINAMEEYLTLAPMHNRYYIEAIKQFREVLPGKLLVGSFETTFHRTIPPEARTYGVPYEWKEKYGIQRYGYHGASHSYIAKKIVEMTNGKEHRLISCHLGGSSSVCAIKNGQSVDVSFGFSGQSGLMHSSRVGDLDAFVPIYLMKDKGFSIDELIKELTEKSGLLGISGVSNDMRDIEEEAEKGNERAKLAINTFCYEIKKFIGSYYSILGGLDYIVFTGGIGENSHIVRNTVCNGLGHMGIKLDPEKNLQGEKERLISADDSRVKIYIIPTNEELVISENIYKMLKER